MSSPTRRRLLRSAAAIPFLTHRGWSEAPSTPRLPLGFGTYGLPGFTLPEAIEIVAEAGFDAIEFAAMPGYHADPDEVSPAARKEIRQRLANSGLHLGALMGLPVPDSARTTENLVRMERLVELAHDLCPDAPPLIQGILGGGKWEDKRSLFCDSLGPWVDLSSDAGITLAIKPHRSHAMSLPAQGVALIEEIGAAGDLRLVYDPSHFAHRDLSYPDTITTALPHTAYLVLKDAVMLDGKVRFALPGEAGSIPHTEIVRQFIDGGYTGEICCEVSSQVWRHEGYDPVAATGACFQNLNEIVADLDDSGFTPIFNGKDLEGWEGKPGAWTVRDGAIHCTGESPRKNWLIWRGDQSGDFVLRLDFRWDKGNSGVQVRSDDLGDWQIFGYQVEVAQQDVMGLWHHSLLARDHPKKPQRHLMAQAGESVVLSPQGDKSMDRIQDATAVQAAYRENEWNSMEIVARGDTLVQKINGVTFSTLVDRDTEMSRRQGWIALQDHGKGCAVAFRRIRLRHVAS